MLKEWNKIMQQNFDNYLEEYLLEQALERKHEKELEYDHTICRECNATNQIDDRVCRNCGAEL